MDNKNIKNLIAEYFRKLKNEGIDLKGTIIALKLETELFAIAFEDEIMQILNSDKLKNENPLIYEVFITRKDIIAVIRICPKFCAEAAEKNRDIPPVLDDMAQIVGVKARVCGEVEHKKIVNVLKKNNACLIKGIDAADSGAITVGRTLEHAFATTLILEKSAQAYIEGEYIGGARYMNSLTAWIFHMSYNLSYSKKDEEIKSQTECDIPRSIPNDEFLKRKEIIEFGKKLSEENLVQGTWGNISVRLDDRYMLVTPSGLAYSRLTPYDIVRVDMYTLDYEGKLKPTSEKGMHAALLVGNPDFNCIIHSHPINCSVFAAARKPLPVQNAAEAALIGKEAGYAKAAIPGTKLLVQTVVETIKPGICACIMGSHGMLVCGSSISDAFKKCRAMEKAARDYLDSAARKNNYPI